MRYIVLMILLLPSAISLEITEVMYNPMGSDKGQEYIEVTGNLTNVTVGDLGANDTLILVKQTNSSFNLVVDDSFNHTEINATIYSTGGNIGNGLGNSADSIFFYWNGTLLSNLSYNGSLANDNNLSLQICNRTWIEAVPTPGTENLCTVVQNETIETNTTINQTNSTNTTINETVEPICNISMDLQTDKQLYELGDAIEFRPIPDTDLDFQIEYGVYDLFNLPVREPRVTENSNTKRFTPKFLEPDRAFIIRASLIWVNCSNFTSTTAEQMVVFKGEEDSCSEDVICKDVKTDCPTSKSSGSGGCAILKTPEITSFYTRKKNFAPLIKLYAKSDPGTLQFTSRIEEFNFSGGSIEFNASAEPGRNLYVLELIVNNKVTDTKKLVVDFPVEKLPEREQLSEKVERNKTPAPKISKAGIVYSEDEEEPPFALIGGSIAVAFGGWLWQRKRHRYIKENQLPLSQWGD